MARRMMKGAWDLSDDEAATDPVSELILSDTPEDRDFFRDTGNNRARIGFDGFAPRCQRVICYRCGVRAVKWVKYAMGDEINGLACLSCGAIHE